MTRKTEKAAYTVPSTEEIILSYQGIILLAASGEVESTNPDQWEEGNTDWWNS